MPFSISGGCIAKFGFLEQNELNMYSVSATFLLQK
jgi:hypothetical protein